MSNEHDADFRQLASDANLPTTEAQINAEFEAVREAEGITITNANAFGPFWRFVKAAATTAASWLVEFIITTILPQVFVKTATGVFLELHAWAVNLTRKQAVKAVGVIQFSRIDTAGTLTVPVGTVVQSATINGKVYSLVSTAEATFNDGDATLDVPVEAMGEGSDYNLAAGYYTVLADAITGVDAVTNNSDWLTVPGANKETDEELRDRIRNQFTANNQYHTDAVYTAIIAAFDGVTTENVFFQHDAPRGPGTANSYVMLETGNPGPEFIANIQSEITDNGNHGHGDDLQVFAMPETTHNPTATVWPADNLTAAQITQLLTDVENFTRAAFRENADYTATKTRPWSTFSFSKLGQELHAEFSQLKNVAFDLTHIDSAMDIPRLGTLTVQQQGV